MPFTADRSYLSYPGKVFHGKPWYQRINYKKAGKAIGKKLLSHAIGNQNTKAIVAALDSIMSTPSSGPSKGRKRSASTVNLDSVKRQLVSASNSTTRSGKIGGRRYRRSVTGKYGGRFGSGKRVKKDPFQKGIIYRYEQGGTSSVAGTPATNAQSLVLGHSTSTPANQLLLACCMITKELAKQAGQQIESWDDKIQVADATDKFTLFVWDNLSSTTRTFQDTTPVLGKTFWNIAVSLRDAIYAVVSDTAIRVPIFEKVIYGSGAGVSPRYAQVNLQQFKLTFEGKSYMKLQNISLSGDGEDKADDITNNPLEGRMYESSCNGFYPRWKQFEPVGTMPYVEFTTDPDIGVMNLNSVLSPNQNIQEPPLAYHFKKCKFSTKVKIEPGEIKESKIISRNQLSFQGMMAVFFYWIRKVSLPPNQELVNFGKTKMYILEKALHNRVETTPVSVDWQIDTTLKAYYTYSPQIKTVEKQITF